MEFQSVYHRASDNYCYALDKDQLIINLKTGYDVEHVFLNYGDPFSGGLMGLEQKWDGIRIEMVYKKRLAYQCWWTTTIRPRFKRCRYFFELQTKDGKIYYYFEDRIYSKAQVQKRCYNLQFFSFPWMNEVDINKTPQWVNRTNWYQIFPERFCNGDSKISPSYVKPWAGPKDRVRGDEFYGGDLKGIIDKIDYIASLHITGLYLTPVNESPSTHKYDTIDYKTIDPYFGDKAVMKELVQKAHAKGIRVMLDGVFNHLGNHSMQWRDVLEKGKASAYYDWFMINEWPLNKEGNNAREGKYYAFAFCDKMPKLNTSNPKVRAYILDICEYWIREYDIDGIRLDVANEISHYLCKQLRERLKALKPDIYILGEIWNDSISWLRGDEFDAVMNYPLGQVIMDFWLHPEYSRERFEEEINRCYTLYMQQTNDVLFNLLDSHDTMRLMTRIKDQDKVYQQLTILYTMPGSPCIFYGTEALLEGEEDPDCRRCMPWKEIEHGDYKESIEVVRKLGLLRKTEPLFRSRNFHFTKSILDERVLEYIKIDDEDNEKMIVLLNCSDHTVKTKLKGKLLFSHLCKEEMLLPNGIVIFKLK